MNRTPDDEAVRDDGSIDEITADDVRRKAIGILSDRSSDATQIGVLADELAASTGRDRDRILIFLHQVHLPRMASAGVVEYDWQTGEVVYRGGERIEAALE